MNLILERSQQVKWYTDMRLVFSALPGVCEAHDWLISDIECNCYPDSRVPCDKDPILISGADLLDVVTKHEIQFIWSVFSALRRGSRPVVSNTPYADGNPSFWTGSPRPQLKGALFEIVCWDSTLTLLIGAPDSVVTQFQEHFKDAMDLNQQNNSRKPTTT